MPLKSMKLSFGTTNSVVIVFIILAIVALLVVLLLRWNKSTESFTTQQSCSKDQLAGQNGTYVDSFSGVNTVY